MTISIIDLRIAVRLFLFFVALSSAAWNAKAQQYQVAAPATPTYTYQTTQPAATQPTYQVVQPAQYAQQPAAPVYYYQSAYAGMETTTQPVEAAPVAAAPAAAEQPAAASYGDPYGFTAWLNGSLRALVRAELMNSMVVPSIKACCLDCDLFARAEGILAAGSVAIVDNTYLGWVRLSFENGQTGWVRKEDVVWFWR